MLGCLKFLQEEGVIFVKGRICRWQLQSEDAQGKGLVKKPCGFITGSPCIARRLDKLCTNLEGKEPWHRHVLLLNGRATAAAKYTPEFVREILAGLV